MGGQRGPNAQRVSLPLPPGSPRRMGSSTVPVWWGGEATSVSTALKIQESISTGRKLLTICVFAHIVSFGKNSTDALETVNYNLIMCLQGLKMFTTFDPVTSTNLAKGNNDVHHSIILL